jgi:hypothetical protein
MTYTPLEREEGTELSVRMKTITKLIYLAFTEPPGLEAVRLCMKKSISLTSALSILALMLVSCSSGTTASTTRQTTTTAATTAEHAKPSQPIGYQDMGAGGSHTW